MDLKSSIWHRKLSYLLLRKNFESKLFDHEIQNHPLDSCTPSLLLLGKGTKFLYLGNPDD